MNELRELLRPYSVDNDKLIRLGVKSDGGYILNQKAIDNIELCYTYGVGTDISFEEDLLKLNPNVTVHLYDHTVNSPTLSKGMIYHKEGLAGFKQPNLDSFFNHLKINNDSLNKKILLKLDAEEAEYDLFKYYPISHFKTLSAIVLEIHNIKVYYRQFVDIISNLQSYFTITHVHANNCGCMFQYKDFSCPEILEITLLNNNLIDKKTPLHRKYPIQGLDYPNAIRGSDFTIDFNFIE